MQRGLASFLLVRLFVFFVGLLLGPAPEALVGGEFSTCSGFLIAPGV